MDWSFFKGKKIIQRGLEREALRITEAGHLSQERHPSSLGASLTNKYITTDYSEALLELVTPVFENVDELYFWLDQLHRFCGQNIREEYLWPFSMPCILEDPDKIPIAQFGTSNVARMKHLYRVGLSHRYGSAMQVIAGIHYNFSLVDSFWEFFWKESNCKISLEEFKTAKYMALVRNFMRIGWIVPYLFGASPAVCKSFIQKDIGNYPFLRQREDKLIFGEYATSLRMSELGYRNVEQDTLQIGHNSLNQYLSGLVEAVRTPSSRWQKIDQAARGERCQLNSSILQIENEYYGMIRPKQVARSGESPSVALLNRGVQYVEVRSVDINPFDANGLSRDQIRLLDLILLTCLRQGDQMLDQVAEKELKNNFNQVVLRGRDPQLKLSREGKSIRIREWGSVILEQLQLTVCDLGDLEYQQVIEKYGRYFEQPDLTPSGQLLKRLENSCYCTLGMELARQYQIERQGTLQFRNIFESEAVRSHWALQELEQRDREFGPSFEEYLDNYYRATMRCLVDNAKSIHQNQATP